MSQPSPVASGQEMRTSRSLSSLAPGMALHVARILSHQLATSRGCSFPLFTGNCTLVK